MALDFHHDDGAVCMLRRDGARIAFMAWQLRDSNAAGRGAWYCHLYCSSFADQEKQPMISGTY